MEGMIMDADDTKNSQEKECVRDMGNKTDPTYVKKNSWYYKNFIFKRMEGIK